MNSRDDDAPPPEGTPGVWYCPRRGGETEYQKYLREWDEAVEAPDPGGSEFGA